MIRTHAKLPFWKILNDWCSTPLNFLWKPPWESYELWTRMWQFFSQEETFTLLAPHNNLVFSFSLTSPWRISVFVSVPATVGEGGRVGAIRIEEVGDSDCFYIHLFGSACFVILICPEASVPRRHSSDHFCWALKASISSKFTCNTIDLKFPIINCQLIKVSGCSKMSMNIDIRSKSNHRVQSTPEYQGFKYSISSLVRFCPVCGLSDGLFSGYWSALLTP